MLLQYGTETELVKNCMIKCMQNFGEDIRVSQWGSLWTKEIKFTACQAVRENWYKMFIRWYITT